MVGCALFFLLLLFCIHFVNFTQEWAEENEGSSLVETLYKALDEVFSTLLNQGVEDNIYQRVYGVIDFHLCCCRL